MIGVIIEWNIISYLRLLMVGDTATVSVFYYIDKGTLTSQDIGIILN